MLLFITLNSLFFNFTVLHYQLSTIHIPINFSQDTCYKRQSSPLHWLNSDKNNYSTHVYTNIIHKKTKLPPIYSFIKFSFKRPFSDSFLRILLAGHHYNKPWSEKNRRTDHSILKIRQAGVPDDDEKFEC